ncbi:hypothetical protein V8C26DRAFT_402054 [Trichoderma gracile]
MSGLEALSLACSIMQVISFTKEVLTVCKDVYEGRPTADSQMEDNARSIQGLLDEMHRNAGSVQQQTKEEKELYAVAQKCSEAAEELQKEIRQVTRHQKPGDYKRAFIAGYQSIFGKRKVTGLYDQFCKYQKTLETHILVRLCTKSDAIELQIRQDFDQLSNSMKHFIIQMSEGHTDMAALVTRDGTQTREQIQQSEERVKQEINYVQTEVVNEAKRERLLRSLKYESMNSRRTGLKPAHEATYISMYDSLEVEAPDGEAPDDQVAIAWRGFIAWLKSEKQVFWIQGKPGSGKSTLLKFILQHKKTQLAVDRWRPDTLMISHFFWKPGDILQKNLRGLLCSLNHQLLSIDHTLVGLVLSEFMFAGAYDIIGDWEITQLKSVFHCILKQCNRSVFFLIDGLDEATDTEEILQLLDSLIGIRNVKLCISSRGEEVFLRKFSEYDGFTLEDLTRNDMLKFAMAGMPPSNERYPSEFLEDLSILLVDKAEGVFLWLVLALESVKRGLRNNDGRDVIHSRLKQLPNELEQLYADMWDRLGEDKAIYQREAARYFALLVTNQLLLEEYNRRFASSSFSLGLTSFLLMLDSNEALRRVMLNKSCKPPVSQIDQECADVARSIPIKTAGLLVNRCVDSRFHLKLRQRYIPLRKHLGCRVEFLHRTLLDFFLQSEVGRNILAQGQTRCIRLELATILVCQLRILVSSYTLSKARVGGAVHYCVWMLGRLLAQGSTPRSMVVDLLHDLERLFIAGLIPWDGRPSWYPLPPFEILLIEDPAFKEFLQSRIESRGASYATLLLREAVGRYIFNGPNETVAWESFELQISISNLDVNINSADICLYYAQRHNIFAMQEDGGYLIAPHESIASAVVKLCLRAVFDQDELRRKELMPMLLPLLEQTPDLNERTSFYLQAEYSGYRGPSDTALYASGYHSLLSLVLYDWTYIDEEVRDGNRWLSEVIVVLEVNLRYLIEYFFRAIPSEWKDEMPQIIRAQHLLEKESSKPYIRPRFLIEVRETNDRSRARSVYRFTGQGIDILADGTITEATVDTVAKYGITRERVDDYRKSCERFHGSILSVLADEKLGFCGLADMGFTPPRRWRRFT